MKITDLRCAVIGKHPIVRIVTDEGLYGLGEVEYTKTYLKPWVLHFKDALIGEDPTDVERVMLKIRQRGSFKPYGAAVSVIEHALWDIAGKAAGVPAYKMLGGKVRDKVRVYNGSIRRKRTGDKPEDYAADVKWMMERPENFFMVKQGISFHSNMKDTIDDFHYGVKQAKAGYHGMMDQGVISERGFNHMLDCVAAMKEVLGDKVSLALDCGPGWMLPDAIRFARAVEKYNIMWLEDMLTGDYVPWVNPQAYRELTLSTSTPIHTGEQIYSRHNFKELIETQAVRVIGPDPADIGGMAELKWVAEHAYMHSILIAPHGTANGLLGLGALLDWWEGSDRRRRLRERLRAVDRIDPDDVIMEPAEARRRGLTSTVTFPRGNLAPEGSVIKSTAIDPSVVDPDGVYRKVGPARVFTRERAAIAAIKSTGPDRIEPGDVLVLICRGPLGAGMEEIYQITAALRHLSWGKHVALVTDARFSGVSTGACIGHVGPEALAGGPIGKLRDGDLVRIVVDRVGLEGSVDLVGHGATEFGPDEGARELARRAPRPDLSADPDLSPDTRLWAALQHVGGGRHDPGPGPVVGVVGHVDDGEGVGVRGEADLLVPVRRVGCPR